MTLLKGTKAQYISSLSSLEYDQFTCKPFPTSFSRKKGENNDCLECLAFQIFE